MDGALLKDYTVVVFAETRSCGELPMTRWVTARSRSGRALQGPEPARRELLAIAVDYLPQGEWGDPELLDRLKSKAKRFTLDEGAATD